MENELFGHVQGAFTGASTSQPGLINEANTGTLFLDDIDCLPILSQVKLLRFLQEKEYRQLGSSKMCQADVRFIAATNIDLEKAVNDGKLRQDLYYRVNIIPLTLPSLRERREDIPVLARHFLEKYAIEFNKDVSSIASEALQMLKLHNWPGNVRELEHVIERAVLFSEQKIIREIDIMLPNKKVPACKASFKESKTQVINKFEKNYIEALLLASHGNITSAAKAAQKNRRAFWQLIRKHQIDAKNFKTG
jgi:transcriptional regulator with PAS, ATPase and Fis domain